MGALSLLIGDPGVGKSVLTVEMAARVTKARDWPEEGGEGEKEELPGVESGCERGFSHQRRESGREKGFSHQPLSHQPLHQQEREFSHQRESGCEKGFSHQPLSHQPDQAAAGVGRGGAVPGGGHFCGGEDAAVLEERLRVAGADLAWVSVIDGVRPPFTKDVLPLRLPGNAEQLEDAIRSHGYPRLVVLDPLHGLLEEGAYSSPDRQSVLLGKLADVARRRQVALVGWVILGSRRIARCCIASGGR